VKRPLPVWIAAVVPATLVGHGLAYALAGRSVSDAHHSWVAPALECSLALLAAIWCAMLAGALLKAGILVHTAAERSTFELLPRLALAQLAMFALMERLEGTQAGLAGCAMQVLVAFCVAYVLALFSRLLVRCIEKAEEASRYLQRLLEPTARFVSRRPYSVAYALSVRAGTARFQRPPPIA
jgi:hypothetical protein